MTSPEFVLVYDLRAPGAEQLARRHARYWGRIYTDRYVLDHDYVVLAFRSAGERWRAWEAVRKEWVLGREEAAA